MKRLVVCKFIFLSFVLILVGCSDTSDIESKMKEEIDGIKSEIDATKEELTSVEKKLLEITEEAEWAEAEIAMAEELGAFQEEYEEYEADETFNEYEGDRDESSSNYIGTEVLTYEEFIAQPYIIEQYLLQGERAPYLVDYDAKHAYEVYRRTHEKYNQLFSD
ncbi:hypothetical protein [Pseudogracilibacillus sp. SO10305]|uniref:hypothetical protein n=1 Tax=Pseudogracilibacillus sp. SO10305 TaxID=3098292 RepID=UPI00300DE7E3